MGILIQNTISKFSKPKTKLKKDPLKLKRIKNIYKEAPNQSFIKETPPKVGKFSNTKNQTQKRLAKVPKNEKHK